MSNSKNDSDNLKIIAQHIGDLITNQSTYNEFMQEFIGEKRVESNLALELLGNSKVNKLPITAVLRLNSNQPYNKNSDHIIANGVKLSLDNDWRYYLIYLQSFNVISIRYY